jgi:LysR family transcriptional regulator, cys regulon transcriptional activator
VNLQQLRLMVEIARRGFNLTEVAAALHTVPSALSKQLRELEAELGVDLVLRKGKRILGFTEPGMEALKVATRALAEVDNLRQLASHYRAADAGELVLATTHTQARYALPAIISEFRRKHPRVHLALHQENPEAIARMVIEGVADVGIATESLFARPELATFDFYSWSHRIVVRQDHELAQVEGPISLETLCAYPIITYHRGYTGRGLIDASFIEAGLRPDIVLSALDADVIKTYVELRLGIGIIADVAYDAARDQGLRLLACEGLKRSNQTRIALRRGRFLRDYVYDFMAICVPSLEPAEVQRVLSSAP